MKQNGYHWYVVTFGLIFFIWAIVSSNNRTEMKLDTNLTDTSCIRIFYTNKTWTTNPLEAAWYQQESGVYVDTICQPDSILKKDNE